MSLSPLVTKVLLPQRRESLLTRQRLLSLLYDLTDRKLITVSAPAGYGKTTLLVDFAHHLEAPVCWYSLDPEDRDPYIFLEHLLLSLQHRFPDFGARTHQVLKGQQDLSHGAPGIVDALLNEVIEVVPHWFVLVLDDYHHLARAPEVDAILQRLLHYQQGQFLVVTAGRTAPNLAPLVRLAARYEVGYIDQEALSFRADEIQRLLAQNFDLSLSEQQAAELAQQSEGWIACILLAAHAAGAGGTVPALRIPPLEQSVYEYLAQEVLIHQQPAVKDFLLASSTLQAMNPDLCREALGLAEADKLLTLIEKQNLFVTCLEQGWYKYHHLMQKFLQEKFKRERESEWATAHHRAARWFEAYDQPEEAVHHYLIVQAHAQAGKVMESAAKRMHETGRLDTLVAWALALPEALRERFPRLALFSARAADALGQMEQSLALIETAESGYRTLADAQGLAYAQLLRCQLWLGRGRYEDALKLGREVLAMVQEANVPVTYEAHRIIGRSCMALGRLAEAEYHLQQAIHCAQVEADPFDQSSARLALGACLQRQGQLREAVVVQREAVAMRRQLGNPSALAIALNDVGFCLYTMGRYSESLPLLLEALELARQSGYRQVEGGTLLSLGELLRDLGVLARAAEFCTLGLTIADELEHKFLAAYGRETLGLIYRCQGDRAAACQAIRQGLDLAAQQKSPYQLGRYSASLGLVQVEMGEVETGTATLSAACEQLAQIGAQGELARARFFAACALFATGQEQEALNSLEELFETIDPQQQQQPLFVVEGRYQMPLLERACEQGIGGDLLASSLEQMRSMEQTAQAVLKQFLPPVEKQNKLRIFGFGHGRVERDGAEITLSEWEAASARHLFFYLLTHAPRSRDQIAAALWPDLPPHKVKATFHSTKSRLNRALRQEALYFDHHLHLYSIHPDLEYWFDVKAFENLLNDSKLGRRAEKLQQATQLYKADFLEDCYTDWCLMRREALREQCLAAIDELAGRLLAKRQYRTAIQILCRGLEMDNLRESFYRQLMRAYALCGERGHALAQYQRCIDALQYELDIDPSSETTALYRRIRDGLPLN
ncbi:MAG: tetratricopeptide repeat protein [Anaerolineae bacterium]|nr:tetratricopeptide repeat protein [Anaerolineae bacterium]